MSRLHFNCRHRYPGGFVCDASFAVGDGVTALFGPSGSGKSTILSILSGAIHPAQGKIELSGQILFDSPAKIWLPIEKRLIGVLFQDHLLFPHLSVEGNLRYGLRRRNSDQISYDKLIKLLELTDLLDRSPSTLSGGQRQRTALGRAILSNPKLLLLDEPFSALDTPLKERILGYLEMVLAEWRIPTLFVSHDQTDVRRFAEQVVILQEGKVQAAGPTAATLDRTLMTSSPSQIGPINLLKLEPIQFVDGHWEGHIGAQRVHLPGETSADWGGLVRFLPRDVTLACEDAMRISTRNALVGTVIEVLPLQGRTFVSIDVGKHLWAEVTPDAARELAISPGVEVHCLIKASAIELIC